MIDDGDLQDEFDDEILPLFITTESNLVEYEGNNGKVHMAESRIRLTT